MELSDIGKHCIWADRETINLLKTIKEEDFNKTPEHTGRSIKDLVVHILSGYDMALGGNYKSAMDKYGNKDQKNLLKSWDSNVLKFITEIENDSSKSYTIKMDDESERKIEGQNLLLSYTDHSTYHRGQIISTFKFITGKEAVSTDYYTYLTKKEPI
jgi:uncharacterized damage-inducible protein DinB